MKVSGSKQKSHNWIDLVDLYGPMARSYSLVLGTYYLIISYVHLFVLKGALAAAMAALAAISSLIIMTLRLGPMRGQVAMDKLELGVCTVNFLAVINIACHGYLAQDQGQFVYLPMLAFGVAVIGPTKRSILFGLACVTCGAVFLTLTGPASFLVNNIFTAITAIGGAYAVAIFLHDLVQSQATARAHAQQLLADVEQERQRAQSLANEADFANRAKTDFLPNMSHELRTP